MNGNVAAVGAPDKNVHAGEAYVFVFDGTNWTQQSTLIASDGFQGDLFGSSVSVSLDRVAVGAPSDPPVMKVRAGAALSPKGIFPSGIGRAYIFGGAFPLLTKSFNPTSIPVSTTSTLTLTLSNSTASTLTGVAFTDMLPMNLTVATPNNLMNTCGGMPAATAGMSTISLSGVSLASMSMCTLSLTVTGSVPGVYLNTTSTVTTTNSGPGAAASATLTLFEFPVIAKMFGAASVTLGGSTSLTITVSNPSANSISLTSVGFADMLPSGLLVANPASLSNGCGGMAAATAGTGTVSLAGVTLAPGGSCTVSLNVTGTVLGVKNNSVTVVSDQGIGNTAMAALTVIGPPVLTKTFNPTIIPTGQTTTLTFAVSNVNPTVALTGVGFTDPLPAGLLVATPNGLAGTCGGGTITAVAGSNTVTLAGATLPPNSGCTFSVSVIGSTAGTYLNATDPVVSANGGPGLPASAPLVVGATGPSDTYQIRYAANLNQGDSFVDITNNGASGGNLCVNVYTFDESEEMLSCCSCFVTPNGLASLSVKKSLIANNLTPEIPNSIVIKLLATAGGASAASCNAGTPTTATLAPGMHAWGTSLHAAPTSPVSYATTETPFSIATLSQGELNHLTSFCGFIQGNASGFGICSGCSIGGLGATTQQ